MTIKAGAVKLDRLPDRKPVKIALSISPELHKDLSDYARAYAQTHGVQESVATLIPFMLDAFIAGDAGFRRLQKQWSTGEASAPAGRSKLSVDASVKE